MEKRRRSLCMHATKTRIMPRDVLVVMEVVSVGVTLAGVGEAEGVD
jgi:hypothetical protein